jgi:hypothetical protein
LNREIEENGHFNESMPNGISNTIDFYGEALECCGQNVYQLLLGAHQDAVKTQRK